MANRIDWYLIELERMLKGRISEEELADLEAETRSHLEAEVARQGESGMEVARGQRVAISAFGHPAIVARQVLKESRSVGSRSAFRWALTVVLAVYGFPMLMFNGPRSWLFEAGPLHWSYWVWIGLGLMLAFAALAGNARRPMILPICGTVLAGFLVFSLWSAKAFVWIVRPDDAVPMACSEVQRDMATIHETRAMNKGTIALLQTGTHAFAASRTPEDVPAEFRRGKAFVVPAPMRGNGYPYRYGTDLTPSFDSARTEWRLGGLAEITSVQHQDAEQEEYVRSYARAQRGFDWLGLSWSLRIWGIWAVCCMAGLILLHALASGLRRGLESFGLLRRGLA
jgi:hypothetical protein